MGRIGRNLCFAVVAYCSALGAATGETVYLTSNGWHTGITLARAALDLALIPEAADFPDARFIEFGWGDREFYQADDPGAALALKAALLPSEAVLHLVALARKPALYFPTATVIELTLTPAGLNGLQAYLGASFTRDGARAKALRHGLYRESKFYPASGSFHLFNTCNSWAARALAAAGLGLDPEGVIEADDLLERLRGLRQARDVSSGAAAK